MENISKKIQPALLIIPTLSFLLSTFYYYVFFIPFENLNTNILSLSDYFSKSAYVFSSVLFSLTSLLLCGYLLGIATSLKIDQSNNKFTKALMSFSLPIYMLVAITLPSEFRPIFSISCVILAIPLLSSTLKNISKTSKESQKNTLLDVVRFASSNPFVWTFVLASSFTDVYWKAYSDSHSFQRWSDGQYVQAISSGYLIGEKGELKLYNSRKQLIATDKIRPIKARDIYCRGIFIKICKQS